MASKSNFCNRANSVWNDGHGDGGQQSICDIFAMDDSILNCYDDDPSNNYNTPAKRGRIENARSHIWSDEFDICQLLSYGNGSLWHNGRQNVAEVAHDRIRNSIEYDCVI